MYGKKKKKKKREREREQGARSKKKKEKKKQLSPLSLSLSLSPQLVPQRVKDSLHELGHVMEGHGNYKNYRELLAKSSPPLVPYFGA
jgi:hypothetical protein